MTESVSWRNCRATTVLQPFPRGSAALDARDESASCATAAPIVVSPVHLHTLFVLRFVPQCSFVIRLLLLSVLGRR